MKRLMMVIIGLALIAGMGFANGGAESSDAMAPAADMARGDYTGKLVVWSFTDELQKMSKEYFEAAYPGVEVEYAIYPNDDQVYLNKINTTLRSGSGVPDVFTGEAAYYLQFVGAGYWEPLTAYGAEDLMTDLIDYVPSSSRDSNGEITALSWQATPGALFYRRGIAKEVLGTDDPDAVSAYTSDLNKFYELGEMIKDEYDGEKYLLAGYSDMSEFIYNLRAEPYVIGDTLTIPEGLITYMEVAKKMRENGVEGGAGTWSPPWFSSMADGSVFSYILPTWGLHYVLKPNAEPEAHAGDAEYTGDWGLAVPPASYSWGGTWLGINKLSTAKDLAWQFVKFIGSDAEFLEAYAKDSGDFVANTKVIAAIKDDFSDPFLGGQNHYAYFAGEADKVDVSRRGPWDLQIQDAWGDQVDLYANGEKSMDQAIADFGAAVKEFLPNITVVVE